MMGVLTEAELKAKRGRAIKDKPETGGHPAPWLLAARVLRGGPLLSWSELWDVLRWYAHNRGYEANVPWARESNEPLSDQLQQERDQDNKRQKRAVALMNTYGVNTMAETVFCYLFDETGSGRCCVDPVGVDRLPFFQRYFKEEECIFPRKTVQDEVLTILELHRALIDNTSVKTDVFIRALLEDWTALPEDIRGGPRQHDRIWLPRRYGQIEHGRDANGRPVHERKYGGLLFGQLRIGWFRFARSPLPRSTSSSSSAA